MVSKKRVRASRQDRIRVAGLVEAGYSARYISRELGLQLSFVSRWAHRLALYGTVDDLPRRGAPRARTPSLVDRVRRKLSSGDGKSSREVAAELTAAGTAVSRMTVQRAAHDAGLASYRPSKRPLLTAEHRSQRLAFARRHLHNSDFDRTRVQFDDETTRPHHSAPNQAPVVGFRRAAHRPQRAVDDNFARVWRSLSRR